MSLDIWGNIPIAKCECPKCNHEWTDSENVFNFNITHNLKPMAKEAGIDILWDWDLIGKKAWYLIDKLKIALDKMSTNPEHYKQFDSANGWGIYNDFLPWLNELLEACEEYPHAILRISK